MNRTDRKRTALVFGASLLIAGAWGCEEENSGPPTCQSAMSHVYDQGCYFVDEDGLPLTEVEMVPSCLSWQADSVTWGCQASFEMLLNCFATMDDGMCGACDTIMTTYATCLVDAQDVVCEGYVGEYSGCCVVTDPCGWADDGICQCEWACDWDVADCDRNLACQNCLETTCAAESEACGASMDCVMLLQCLIDCTDDPCMSECETTYPGGVSLVNDYFDCLLGDCGEWCA